MSSTIDASHLSTVAQGNAPDLQLINAELAAIMAEFAHRYAVLGWPVLPSVEGVGFDRDLTPRRVLDASREPGVLQSWWRRNPEAGICTPCAGRLLVVKIEGRKGHETWAKLVDKHGSYPTAPRMMEGLSTWVFFRVTPERPGQCTMMALGEGLTVYGPGGCVPLPPSTIAGVQLRWRPSPFQVEPPPCPEWILDKIEAPGLKRIQREARRIARRYKGDGSGGLVRQLDVLLAEAVAEGLPYRQASEAAAAGVLADAERCRRHQAQP